ncbi:uncharacterized protein B0H64DRAFT_430024 [Chaetomium fimeti]|uniref:DUF7905 domain-containing protein n=1 Tax=Chaetomium fimeti TaxID=1854472 RepID=A0AAE0HMI0_9PEZI|nr:hypothetical protein B0H64DRAFT_430024 [Chaetomium fimeti]
MAAVAAANLRSASPLPADNSQSSEAPPAISSDLPVRVTAPGCLAPPRRGNRSSRQNGVFDPRKAMDQVARRKIFTSGADQVTKRPPPRLNVAVVVSWPAPGRGFKDVHGSDTDVMAVISRTARDHEAMIEVEDVDSAVTVTVKATNRAKAAKVIALLRTQLLHRPEEELWRARLLVNPPTNNNKDLLTVVLQSKEGTTGRCITAAKIKNLGSTDIGGVAEKKARYKADLAKTLDKATEGLRHEPNGMYMKVQFGTLILNEWKKDKVEYNFAELQALLRSAGTRGTSKMLNIVSEAAVEALIGRLSKANMELPEHVRDFFEGPNGEQGDPVRSHSIILETKNLTVESTFEPVAGQQDRAQNGKRGKRYTLGPLTTHQLEKQHRATEVITVCPESIHDWGFEIRKKAAEQVTPPSAPFKVEALQKNVMFKGGSLGEGFPNISINDYFLQNNHINHVHGKTTLRYTLGWKYTLDINLFHAWQSKKPGQNAGTMVTTASVALFSDIWDDDMRANVRTPREWENTFAKQFLKHEQEDQAPGDTAAESMDHLLAWVDWIRKALDSA